MTASSLQTESPQNAWRQTTPGHKVGRGRRGPVIPINTIIVSVDTHGVEPLDFLGEAY